MSEALEWNVWRPFFATLAAGTTLIFVVALMMQRCTRSMAWRRTMWQVAFLSLGLLGITEFSGAGCAVWSWLKQKSQSEADRQLLLQAKVIGEPDVRMLLAGQSQQFNPALVSQVRGRGGKQLERGAQA